MGKNMERKLVKPGKNRPQSILYHEVADDKPA
jgi:hypothetical protein